MLREDLYTEPLSYSLQKDDAMETAVEDEGRVLLTEQTNETASSPEGAPYPDSKVHTVRLPS